jgi:two-component system, cell cycle sensor histidine kinase and response regulator CckA
MEKGTIRLVVVDYTMPEMNGFEIINALRQIDPHMRMILSTGLVDEEARQNIKKLEIQASLQKPFTANKLIETVSAVLTGH